MSDAVFGVKEGLLAAFCREDGPAEVAAQGVDGPCHLVEPDFVPSVAAG